jgi:CRP-like cAMP-binding protein
MSDRSIGQALLSHLSTIGQVSQEDADAIASLHGEIRVVRRQEDILKTGDTPKVSVVVLGGFLQRYNTRRDGSRQIHSFYIPTDAPSLETLHIERMQNNLSAVVQSTIGLIPHSDLYALMAERPNVLALFWRESLVQAAIFREWLTRNSRLTADSRMAHLFCEIYTRSTAAGLTDGESCEMPVTQEMLADALGLTGVHVNRTLQSIRETGMVDHKNGRIFIHDFKGLAAYADFDPDYLHLRR